MINEKLILVQILHQQWNKDVCVALYKILTLRRRKSTTCK